MPEQKPQSPIEREILATGNEAERAISICEGIARQQTELAQKFLGKVTPEIAKRMPDGYLPAPQILVGCLAKPEIMEGLTASFGSFQPESWSLDLGSIHDPSRGTSWQTHLSNLTFALIDQPLQEGGYSFVALPLYYREVSPERFGKEIFRAEVVIGNNPPVPYRIETRGIRSFHTLELGDAAKVFGQALGASLISLGVPGQVSLTAKESTVQVKSEKQAWLPSLGSSFEVLGQSGYLIRVLLTTLPLVAVSQEGAKLELIQKPTKEVDQGLRIGYGVKKALEKKGIAERLFFWQKTDLFSALAAKALLSNLGINPREK